MIPGRLSCSYSLCALLRVCYQTLSLGAAPLSNSDVLYLLREPKPDHIIWRAHAPHSASKRRATQGDAAAASATKQPRPLVHRLGGVRRRYWYASRSRTPASHR
ncbi:hypothetical protein BC834DRAFT_674469 [Gloeopeniophorella convolvens]|nr:hypothetical protein BC834DRAFT_674469 [Gloeopeniophorella convolvens]